MSEFPNKNELASLSISKIKEIVESIDPEDSTIELLANDPRAGVQALGLKLENRRKKEERLLHKQEEMSVIEKSLRSEGKKIIAGVDEAGRGPLAGPVVAGAVILPDDLVLPGLDDSKKLTAQKREVLFELITSQAVAWGIGMVEHDEIDETNILAASMKAMRTAVKNMKMNPDSVLVDGNRSPGLDCDERLIVDGDSRCRSIAAASIIAKVTRDRIMVTMDSVFPGYGFAKHKGYGSSQHIDALRELGPCYIHRFSFKIVPAVAPVGSVPVILKERLLKAPTRESFDRAANGIANIRNNLQERDIEMLRSIYKECKKRFIKG